MFSGIVGMLVVLVLLGACNGLVQDSSEGGTNGDGLVDVQISIGEISTTRVQTANTNIDFYDTSANAAKNRDYVTYYEAIFKNGTNYYAGNAKLGDAYLTVRVMPGTGYEVLVLAGTPANNDLSNGEKVLLGSGYRNDVNIVANQVNRVVVKMYGIMVKLGADGMVKGTLVGATPGTTPTNTLTVNTTDQSLRYIQAEKAAHSGTTYADTGNPWYNTAFKELKIQMILANIHPLLRAFSTAIPVGGAGAVAGAGKLFIGEEAKIVPLSYRDYTMNVISFGGSEVLIGNNVSQVTGTINAAGATYIPAAATFITVDYKVVAGTGTGGAATTTIPAQDAVGTFYFNFKYNAFSQASPPTGSSTWNVRNRILWDGEGYYGGGVVFLFGNAGITEVIVEPTW
jgi:hypothetical protein